MQPPGGVAELIAAACDYQRRVAAEVGVRMTTVQYLLARGLFAAELFADGLFLLQDLRWRQVLRIGGGVVGLRQAGAHVRVAVVRGRGGTCPLIAVHCAAEQEWKETLRALPSLFVIR